MGPGPEPRADYDVAIVGAGPAGLQAALVLGRMRRTVLVCDTGDPANAVSHGVGGLLSRDGTPPLELRAISREQIERYPSVEFRDAEVTAASADGEGEGFTLELAGERVSARKLLLAHGLDYALPDVAGVSELWGEAVFHCPYCHGWEVRDRRLGVLVTSPKAVNQALLMRSLSRDILVLANDAGALDDEALGRFERCGVELVEGAVEAVERDGDELRVRVAGRDPLARDALFVQTELSLRTDLAERLGASLDEAGSIAADPSGATDVAGLRAAGDAALPPQSVAAALGCGAIAAYAINAELALEPFEQGSPVAEADPG